MVDQRVFAREFFALDDRGDLPKVPACEPYNRKKSQLEHYLTAILPFGGRYPAAAAVLNDLVPPRLERNAKLHRALQAGFTRELAVENENGRLALATVLPIDSEKLERLFGLIARGPLGRGTSGLMQCPFGHGHGRRRSDVRRAAPP